MSVPNHHMGAVTVLPSAGDTSRPDAPLAASQVTPWLKWCYGVVDRAFGFDLRDEELRQLLGSRPPR